MKQTIFLFRNKLARIINLLCYKKNNIFLQQKQEILNDLSLVDHNYNFQS